MKTRKIPLRKCVGCNENKPKKELIRVVKNKENELNIDLVGKADGRGAYICNNTDCFKKAKESKSLNRALQIGIPDEIYDSLLEEISHDN